MAQNTFNQELALNRQVYESLREKIRRDYSGQYVAIAFGKIVALSPDFDEAKNVVEKLDPAPEHVVIFPADEEPAWEPFESISSEFEEPAVDNKTFDQEMAQNRQAYETMRDIIRRDFAGQYVAIAFGKIVGVSPNFHEIQEIVEKLEPSPKHVVAFLAEDEPVFEPYENTYKEFF